jgi:hypothetical protein
VGNTKYRHYSHNRLVSWIQRRCIICKRFLSKKQHKLCSRCYKKKHNNIIRNRMNRKYKEDESFRNRKRILSLQRYYDTKK